MDTWLLFIIAGVHLDEVFQPCVHFDLGDTHHWQAAGRQAHLERLEIVTDPAIRATR
jgi:hypothetical protein